MKGNKYHEHLDTLKKLLEAAKNGDEEVLFLT
jgi:hypothetical protein